MVGRTWTQSELVALVREALKEFAIWRSEHILNSDIEAWLTKQLNPSGGGKTCGYCGHQGADVNSTSYAHVGGKGNVSFSVCDDTGACMERLYEKKFICERCGMELPRFEAYRRHWQTTHGYNAPLEKPKGKPQTSACPFPEKIIPDQADGIEIWNPRYFDWMAGYQARDKELRCS